MIKKLTTGIILLAAITGCQKKDETAPDPSKVTISITQPTPGQVFQNGDTAHIQASVSYISELHGYEVSITDTATGEVLLDDDQHVHSDHFDIQETLPLGGAQARNCELHLVVELDHDGHSAEKTIWFQYQP